MKNKKEKLVAPKENDVRTISILSWCVFLFVFGIYLMTKSPGISWEHFSGDSGDLITSAWILGIPHPTGYPLFCIVGWIWSHVIQISNVASRMNAMSGFFSALASAIAFRAMFRSYGLFPAGISVKMKILGATASALLLAFSLDVWKQSVITEVYTLNLFFAALISLILIELMLNGKKFESAEISVEKFESRRNKLIMLLGLSEGLALTNHLTSILFLPPILFVLFIGKTGITLKNFLLGAMMTVLPLFLYLYLPIRSRMNPPLDWGNPENWEGFFWVVTGRQFEKLMFSMMPYQSLQQIMKYNSISDEFGALGAIAAILGVVALFLYRDRRISSLLILTLMFTGSGLFYLTTYYIKDPEGYLLPLIYAAALWSGWSVTLLNVTPKNFTRQAGFLLSALLFLAPISALTSNYNEVDLSGNYDAIRFGENSFQMFEKNALVLEITYERAFTLWYYREVEYKDIRSDVDIIFIEHTLFDWGLEQFKRRFPDVKFPDSPVKGEYKDAKSAEWIIVNNIDTRPIYIGASVKSLAEKGWKFEATGLLYRVYPPETWGEAANHADGQIP